MGEGVPWSDLPDDLVNVIADRSTSNIDLLRIRSICKPWRSAVAAKQHRFERILPGFKRTKYFLSSITFFRVSFPSSCPQKGWLIESKFEPESGKVKPYCPLSRGLVTSSVQTLDLLKFGVSEIHKSYNVKCVECRLNRLLDKYVNYPISDYSGKVVILDNLVLAVNNEKELLWCKSGEESSNCWERIKNQEAENFLDITLHKGQVYVLDLENAIWWIRLPQLDIFQFTHSIPMDYYDTDCRLVEYCGDLCIVRCFRKNVSVGRTNIERTVGFKVYRMDQELVRWVEVDSLGDKALIVATNSCFTVSAADYYECLENAIYFTDNEIGGKRVKVLKLDDGSITDLIDSSPQSCFQMFFPPFL